MQRAWCDECRDEADAGPHDARLSAKLRPFALTPPQASPFSRAAPAPAASTSNASALWLRVKTIGCAATAAHLPHYPPEIGGLYQAITAVLLCHQCIASVNRDTDESCKMKLRISAMRKLHAFLIFRASAFYSRERAHFGPFVSPERMRALVRDACQGEKAVAAAALKIDSSVPHITGELLPPPSSSSS